jgi:type II secretory pathway pseudopilin PulG
MGLRSTTGASLIEMLVAMFLMSFVSAAIFGLAIINNQEGEKIFNKADSLNAAREVMDTIGEDVRMARSVGDLYGPTAPPTTQTVGHHAEVGGVYNAPVLGQPQSVPYFPSAGDPIYGNGTSCGNLTPPGGWPAFPGDGTATGTPAGGQPYYTLGPDTLIIQVPIFDLPGAGGIASYPGGFPVQLYIPTQGQLSSQTPAAQSGTVTQPTVVLEAVDTFVFQIVPDPDQAANPGEYDLQVAGFPGCGKAPNGKVAFSNMSLNGTPRTILKGIVGPLDSSGKPAIFQYIDSSTPATPKSSIPFPYNEIPNISGVIVTLELKNHAANSSGASSSAPVTVGLKSEMYMRNNALATVVGL